MPVGTLLMSALGPFLPWEASTCHGSYRGDKLPAWLRRLVNSGATICGGQHKYERPARRPASLGGRKHAVDKKG